MNWKGWGRRQRPINQIQLTKEAIEANRESELKKHRDKVEAIQAQEKQAKGRLKKIMDEIKAKFAGHQIFIESEKERLATRDEVLEERERKLKADEVEFKAYVAKEEARLKAIEAEVERQKSLFEQGIDNISKREEAYENASKKIDDYAIRLADQDEALQNQREDIRKRENALSNRIGRIKAEYSKLNDLRDEARAESQTLSMKLAEHQKQLELLTRARTENQQRIIENRALLNNIKQERRVLEDSRERLGLEQRDLKKLKSEVDNRLSKLNMLENGG